MPIYEYRCNGCGRRVQLFFRSFSTIGQGECPHCRSSDLHRLPSRVSYVRSDSAYQDLLDDPSSLDNVDYDDPRAVAEWTRRMGQAAGVDMGSDYEEMLDEIERGAPDELDAGEGDFGGSPDYEDSFADI